MGLYGGIPSASDCAKIIHTCTGVARGLRVESVAPAWAAHPGTASSRCAQYCSRKNDVRRRGDSTTALGGRQRASNVPRYTIPTS